MEDWPLTNYSDIIAAVNDFDEKKYAGTRNFIDGHVSHFSPYISRGVISTQMVFEAVLKKNPKAVRGKFVQELLWRDYFQRLLQAKPDLAIAAVKESKTDFVHNGIPNAILEAQTGLNAIDAAIVSLYETGYMHNHFRMYVAALCCNIAKCRFNIPARWMYYHLLDADIASNFASWQWVAGHLTWKTYIANQDNIDRHSKSHQPGTFLDNNYQALEQMAIPSVLQQISRPDWTTKLPPTALPELRDCPVLLYTLYNLDPLWHEEGDFNRVLILEPSHFEQYPISKKVLDFILKLAKNIKGLHVFGGEFETLKRAYPQHELLSKEHPIVQFVGAKVEPRDWIVPEVDGYFESFSKYYKSCLPYLIAESGA